MKLIKYFSEIVTLNKEIGKDIKNPDKTDFTDEELELQIAKGEIIDENVRKISISLLNWCFLIFFISMFVAILYYFITKDESTTVTILCLILGILIFISVSYCIFMDKMTVIKLGLENAKEQLRLNSRFEEE